MMIGDDLSLIKEIAVFFHRKIVVCRDERRRAFLFGTIYSIAQRYKYKRQE